MCAYLVLSQTCCLQLTGHLRSTSRISPQSSTRCRISSSGDTCIRCEHRHTAVPCEQKLQLECSCPKNDNASLSLQQALKRVLCRGNNAELVSWRGCVMDVK